MALKGIDVSEDKKSGFKFQGKEIILSKTRGRPVTGLVKKGIERGIYPKGKQLEAALLYAATGNYELASEKSSVPIKFIRKWSLEPWFKDILLEFRHENLTKLDAAFTEVIDKAMVEIKDRLENGDSVVTKSGAIVKKPVGIRDLALVQAINIDKRQLIRGEPTSRSESKSVDATKVLEDLAEKFTAIVNKKRPVELIEGHFKEEVEDAIIISSDEKVLSETQAKIESIP